MILAIACPHCGRRPVLTARNVKYARSFLWGDPLYSEMYLAGCRWCVRWRVQRTVLRNVFEVPVSILTRTLGLLNLFAIVPQNLFAVVWRGSQEHQLKCLSIWLYDEGKEVDDVVIGEDGLTGSDRALVLRLAYLLRNAAAADGEISAEEVRRAVAAIGRFTEGRCTPELAEALLTEGVDEAPPLVGFDFGRRIALLRAVLDVMAADDELTDDERHFVATVGDDLALPPEFVDWSLERPQRPAGAGHASPDGTLDPDVLTLACLTLDLEPSASLAAIKARYAELAVQYNPVTAGWSANTNGAGVVPSEQEARRLEWAYAVMRKRALEAEKAKGKAKGAKNRTTNDRAVSTASIPRPRRREVTAPVRAALNPSALVPEGPAAAPSVQSGEMAPSWEATPLVARETPAEGIAAAHESGLPNEETSTTPLVSDTAGAAALERLMTRRRQWRRAGPLLMVAWVVLPFAAAVLEAIAGASEFVVGLWVLLPFLLPVIFFRIRWLFTRRPRLVLLLRPFSEPTVNDALVRLVQRHLGFLGFTYTLADADVVANELQHRVLGAIPGVNLFSPRRFSARTRGELMQLAASLDESMRRTWGWLFSRRRLFVVPASDTFWRDAVQLLIDSADVVLVEVSETAPGVVWEFEQLRRSAAGAGVVFLARPDRRENAQRSVDHFFHRRADQLFTYDERGVLTDERGFLRAVAQGLAAREMSVGEKWRPVQREVAS